VDGKLVKSCVIYLTKKKFLPVSSALATVQITPKICHGQPQAMCSKYSRFHPNRFAFVGVISECMITVRVCLKVNPIFGWSLASNQTSIVTVIWHKATLLPHMDSSIIFTRWRQCAPNLTHASLDQPKFISKWHVDQFSRFHTAHSGRFLYFTMGLLLSSSLPLDIGGTGSHLIHNSLVPPEYTNQTVFQ